jgi:hypothetical protein
MDNSNHHMPTDPTAHALTEGGKNVGGAPKDPITLRVRVAGEGKFDILDSAWKVLVAATETPVTSAVAHLRNVGVEPFTQVKIVEARFDTRIADGRLKDLGH